MAKQRVVLLKEGEMSVVNIHSHIFAIRRAYSRRFHPKIVLMSGEIKLKMSMKYRCEQVDEGSR